MNKILDYARYIREKLDKKGDTTIESGKGQFNTALVHEGPGGLPLLPKPCPGVKGQEVAEHLKDVIREYFTAHYSKSFIHSLFTSL